VTPSEGGRAATIGTSLAQRFGQLGQIQGEDGGHEPTLELPVPGQGYAPRVLRFVLIAVFVVGCLAYIVIRYRQQAAA